jgi:Raf kinase inhibitor-like YbhB/YbcL family protein
MRTTMAFLVSLCIALPAYAASFTVSSPDVEKNGTIRNEQVFNSFGCSGGNLSPALTWKGAPAETKSFALMVYDPDAPTGSGWWHWVLYNIPASTTGLPKGAGTADGNMLPAGAVQGNTDFGGPGYGGPCPPAGSKAHRYVFTIFALKTEKLELPPNATAAFVGFMVNANTIKKASFTAYYSRKK